MEYKRYYADSDVLVRLITNITIGVALLIFGLMIVFSDGMAGHQPTLLFLLFPVIFLIWGIHPVYYSVTNSSIRIKRPFGSLEYSFGDISDVKRISPSDLGFSYRLFASGGLFGYIGLFSSNKIGKYLMYCTNQDELVLIVCNDKKIVISPADSSSFTNDYYFKSKEYSTLIKAGNRRNV